MYLAHSTARIEISFFLGPLIIFYNIDYLGHITWRDFRQLVVTQRTSDSISLKTIFIQEPNLIKVLLLPVDTEELQIKAGLRVVSQQHAVGKANMRQSGQ